MTDAVGENSSRKKTTKKSISKCCESVEQEDIKINTLNMFSHLFFFFFYMEVIKKPEESHVCHVMSKKQSL